MTTGSTRRSVRTGLGGPFGVHLTAVGLANLADGIVATGVPLVAITLTRSPLLIGVLTASVWLPWLILGLPAGVFVDRWDRRMTMVWALGGRAAVLVTGAALALTDQLSIWWLASLAIGYGITEVFTDIAGQAQVPTLVGRTPDSLRAANARLLAVSQVGQGFVGPPLAGLLVAFGTAWVLGIPGLVVTVAVAVLVVGLSGRFRAVQPDALAPPSLRRELGEGLQILWSHPVLRPLLVGAGLWNFASTAFSAVILLWMVGPGSAGGLSPQVWALVTVAMPVGGLIGSWAAGRVLRHRKEMTVLVVCWSLNGALNVLPLLWPTAVGLALFLLLASPVGVIGNVVTGSIRPRMVPEHVLGKVGGASRVVGFGTMPLGALVGGQVGEVFGIPTVLVGVVVLMLVSTIYVWRQVPQSVVDAHDLPDQ